MPPGIRVTVEFPVPDICPIVELSNAVGTTIESVSTSVCPPGRGESVTEFSADTDGVPDTNATLVFSHGSTYRYRLTHEGDASCPCECLGQFGCPVARYVAQDGTLTVVFYATGYEQLRRIVGELRERFPDGDLKRLVRSPSGEQTHEGVFVDRNKLTARQLEVLETAHEMEYFERPRGANATEIAAELGISPSTFREHLAAAQRKLLGDVL